MPLKVIGAGFPRTGTMSTHAALEQLGFPCYHMKVVMTEPGHIDAWHDFVVGDAPMDWHALFRDFDATVDAPGCYYYKELMDAFPEAKVVLNVRDPEPWYDSLVTLFKTSEPFRLVGSVVPRARKFFRFGDAIMGKILEGDWRDRANSIRAFEAHIANVQRVVPPERLLVYRVAEGWDPLCRFLGRDPPEGVAFPRLNEGSDTVKSLLQRAFGRA